MLQACGLAVACSLMLFAVASAAVVGEDLASATITVLEPVADSTFPQYFVPIRWTSTNLFVPTSVSIDLYRNGQFVRALASGYPNNGSFNMDTFINTIPSNSTGYQVKIASVEEPTVSVFSGNFSIQGVGTIISPYSSNPVLNFAGATKGFPFNTILDGAQRTLVLYKSSDLGLTAGTSRVISSLAMQVAVAPEIDIPKFRIDYQIVSSSFSSMTSGLVFNFVPTNAVNLSVVSSSVLQAGVWVRFNFSSPIEIVYPNNIVFDFSSDNHNAGNFLSTPRPALRTTPDVRLFKLSKASWGGTPYPYAITPFDIQANLNFVQAVIDVEFGASSIYRASGARPTLQEAVPEFTWKGLTGTGNVDVDCATSSDPPCRADTAVVYYAPRNVLLLYGGRGRSFQDSVAFNDLWMMNLTSTNLTWTKLLPSLCQSDSPCRFGHTMDIVDDKLLVVGGQSLANGQGVYITNQLFWQSKSVSQTIDEAISQLSLQPFNAVSGVPAQITAVTHHASAVVGGSLFVFGGLSATGATNRLLEYQWASNSFLDATTGVPCGTACNGVCNQTSLRPECVQGGTLSVLGTNLYLFGGQDASAVYTNALWKFDTITRQWSVVLSKDCGQGSYTRPSCRAFHSAVVRESQITLFGGGSDLFVANDLWQYNAVSNRWSSLDAKECTSVASYPSCVSHHAAVAINDTMIVFAGEQATPASTFLSNRLWANSRTPYLRAKQSVTLNSVAGGDISVQGFWFSSSSVVTTQLYIGTELCSAASVSSTQLNCTAPLGAGANLSVTAVTANPLFSFKWLSAARSFLSYAAPDITGITIPTSQHSSLGGTNITISGTNFGAGSKAYVGTTQCTSTVVVNLGLIYCITPAGAGTNLTISVTLAGQTSSHSSVKFSYDAPSISNVTYSAASTTGGTTVTVQGTNFGAPGSSVQIFIGGTACSSPTVVSPTLATCVSAAGVGASLPVTIQTGGQTSTPTSQSSFSYEPPVIANVSIASGSVLSTAGGARVTVLGSNFGTSSTAAQPLVQIGGVDCSQTEWFGNFIPQQMVCIVPPGTGQQSVRVRIGGQFSANAFESFTYAPPKVTTFTPNPVLLDDTGRITLIGENFGASQGLISVSIGGVPCTNLILETSHTAISCAVPSENKETDLGLNVFVNGQSSSSLNIPFRFEDVSSSAKTLMFTLAGIVLASFVAVFIVMGLQRQEKIIKAASLFFSNLIILGGIVQVISIFWLPSNTYPGCLAPFWLLSLGFTLLFGTLVLKNYRILKLFRNTSMHSRLIKDATLFVWILALLLIDMIILVSYTLTQDECRVPDSGDARAMIALELLVKVIVLLSGLVIAFRSRVIHIKEFDERHTLGYAISCGSLFILLIIPILFSVSAGENQTRLFILRSVSILVVSTLTVFIFFAPKMYQIYRGEEEDDSMQNWTRTMTKRSMSQASRIGGSERRLIAQTSLGELSNDSHGSPRKSVITPIRESVSESTSTRDVELHNFNLDRRPSPDAAAPATKTHRTSSKVQFIGENGATPTRQSSLFHDPTGSEGAVSNPESPLAALPPLPASPRGMPPLPPSHPAPLPPSDQKDESQNNPQSYTFLTADDPPLPPPP